MAVKYNAIGKTTGGGFRYFHKDSILGGDSGPEWKKANAAIYKAKTSLPEDFEYEIVKYNEKTGNVSFLESKDWNTSHEPTIGNSYSVKGSGGEAKFRPQAADPEVYHHKWQFMKPGSPGYEESVARSAQWWGKVKQIQATTDKSILQKIGKKSTWEKTLKQIGLGQ